MLSRYLLYSYVETLILKVCNQEYTSQLSSHTVSA
jgi:hypothetical protein